MHQAAQTACPHCGTPLEYGNFTCRACGAAANQRQIDDIAAEALRLEEFNPAAAAMVWKRALDLLPPHPVVLRLRVKSLNAERKPRVPTVVDAWDMPIFDPRKDDPVPPHGVTISLEKPSALEPGCDEYVLGPVTVSAIDFIALDETQARKCGMPRSDDLWEKLIAYHA